MSAMFETQAAYSPENQQLVREAVFTTHDVDTGEALPTMDSLGSPLTLRSDSNGFLPPFKVAGDRTQVEIRNGAFKTVITTVAGTVDQGVIRAVTEDGPAKDALSATIAEALGGFTVADPRLEAFKSALDGGRSACIWFTGDSTVDWNGTIDPTTRLAQNIAAAYPGHRVCILARNDSSDAWLAPTVVQAGPSGRRHAVLTGTRGLRWRSAAAERTVVNSFDLKMLIAPADWTPAVAAVLFSSLASLSSGFQFQVRLNANGRLGVELSVTGNTYSAQRESTAAVPGVDGEYLWIRATLLLDGTNSTVTFYTSPADDGATWTQLGASVVIASTATSLAPADPAGFYSLGSRGWQPAGDALVGRIAEVRLSNSINGPSHVPALPELWEKYPEASVAFAGSPTVWVINAARSGQDMAYHTNAARLAFETIDYGPSVLVFSDSHNEVERSGKIGWTDPYKAWVDAVRARLPLAAVAVVKQNPHTAAWANEAAYGASHQVRLSELGRLAAREGWSIIDLFAAFKQDPRGLGQLVSADGLHPTPLGYQFSGDEYTRALGIPTLAE